MRLAELLARVQEPVVEAQGTLVMYAGLVSACSVPVLLEQAFLAAVLD